MATEIEVFCKRNDDKNRFSKPIFVGMVFFGIWKKKLIIVYFFSIVFFGKCLKCTTQTGSINLFSQSFRFRRCFIFSKSKQSHSPSIWPRLVCRRLLQIELKKKNLHDVTVPVCMNIPNHLRQISANKSICSKVSNLHACWILFEKPL